MEVSQARGEVEGAVPRIFETFEIVLGACSRCLFDTILCSNTPFPVQRPNMFDEACCPAIAPISRQVIALMSDEAFNAPRAQR